MSKFEAVESRVYRDGVFFLFCDDEEDAQDLAQMFNQETAPLLDELATKDAVILAQSERIKELERELIQIALLTPTPEDVKSTHDFYYYRFVAQNCSGIGAMVKDVLKTEESEDDNG